MRFSKCFWLNPFFYCRIQFSVWSRRNQYWEDCTGSGGWYENNISWVARAMPPSSLWFLNSGKARCSELVASFAACSALTVSCSSVPKKQQPCASQRLPSRHPVTMLDVMASQCVCLDMLLLPIVNVLLKKCCSVILDYSFAALLNFCNFCNFCNLCFAKFRKLLSHGRVTQGLQI